MVCQCGHNIIHVPPGMTACPACRRAFPAGADIKPSSVGDLQRRYTFAVAGKRFTGAKIPPPEILILLADAEYDRIAAVAKARKREARFRRFRRYLIKLRRFLNAHYEHVVDETEKRFSQIEID